MNLNLEIKPNFFQDEERCGFKISLDMKKVWAVELDLLSEFQRICKKYGLVYYADGGTMLGAVRHNGFIPWDDDIDLMMMRDQYEELIAIAPHEFKYPYFFQTEYTDPSSLRGHAQLRNSQTTGILRSETKGIHSFNQGIFIDIFPLDAVPDNEELFEEKIKKREYYLQKARQLANFTDRFTPTPKNKPIRAITKKLVHNVCAGPLRRFINYRKYYDAYENECKKYNDQCTKKVAKYFCIPFNRGQIWFREDFSNTIDMPFEMLELPVPVGYKRIMDIFFGEDWEIPKMVPTYHSGVFFDTERSYIDYL